MTPEAVFAAFWGLLAVGPWAVGLYGDIADQRATRGDPASLTNAQLIAEVTAERAAARRGVLVTFALLFAAVCAASSFVVVILTRGDPSLIGLRQVLAGIAWGTFAAAGWIKATEDVSASAWVARLRGRR